MDRSVYYITGYGSLMTDKERLAFRRLMLEEKANRSNSPAMKKALTAVSVSDDPEVLALVGMDWEQFLQRVHDRILHDHPDEVGRCPKCRKLTATLQAKQCFACGHDWHDAV